MMLSKVTVTTPLNAAAVDRHVRRHSLVVSSFTL